MAKNGLCRSTTLKFTIHFDNVNTQGGGLIEFPVPEETLQSERMQE